VERPMDPLKILRRHNIRPSKGLGQSFLISERAFGCLLEAAELTPSDVVLEVGPGIGTLTRRLADRAGHVVAIELDRKMLAVLEVTLAGRANVHLVEGDFLDLGPAATLRGALSLGDDAPLAYKLVANLPYYITSAALRHVLTALVRPERLVVMVQRDVAQRIVAADGKLSLLAVSVQVFGTPEIACTVPAGAFVPPPKVDSAVLRVVLHEEPRVPEEDLESFFSVVRAGFQEKRKQVHNSLTHNLPHGREVVAAALRAAGVEASRRAETLTIDEWCRLTAALYGAPPEGHVAT
jgi:16S rRNA (adenine1518-N6/adenine1519-N6)-dimethyltransferase